MFLIAMDRPGTTFENTMLGSIAAAGACCVMIPIDTVKTRIVTQRPGDGGMHYNDMFDCIRKVWKKLLYIILS
jgi:solute carrier family 25 S-adenosylmethionine transporter 26